MRIICFTIASIILMNAGAFAQTKAGIEKRPFGKTTEGEPVDLYILTNANGMKTKIMTFGGIVTELWAPDRDGKLADVVLGHDNLKGYLDGHPYFGALVGRYANRIAKGKFTLDGKEYTLAVNNGPNALHGGKRGFDKVVWKVDKAEMTDKALVLQLSYVSKDGEEGYPGTLTSTVTYSVPLNSNEVRIDYSATTDKATPVNLTNHSYFNLAGHDKGDILGQELTINAEEYTLADDTLIPTGKISPVKGTPFDFTQSTPIGKRIGELKGEPAGYDLNYVLRPGKGFKLAARVFDPKSGRELKVFTTEPGIQFYSGNFLDGKDKGKGGAVYKKHAGFCLEAQHFPDSVNQKNFPPVILKPDAVYSQTTVYNFSIAAK